ncbi:hypothetical protein COCNU_scaffold060633G000020 [Cocos nucifera]|nr:hypothetical protein [Cocos nucifera]
MGGGGGHGGGTTYRGYTIHHPKRWHVLTGKGLCATMWVGIILGRGMKTTLMGMTMGMRHLIRNPKGGYRERSPAVACVTAMLVNKVGLDMKLFVSFCYYIKLRIGKPSLLIWSSYEMDYHVSCENPILNTISICENVLATGCQLW